VATDTLEDALSRAVASQKAGDDEATLAALIEAWRLLRHAGIGALVDRVSDRLDERRGSPITDRTDRDR
jgi:hypothetical protein